jgi:tetratricopeptide (TPR) repeat protein
MPLTLVDFLPMRARIAFALSLLAACSSPPPKEAPREPRDCEREAEALVVEGARLNEAGKFAEAADRFKNAVVLDPRNVRAQFDLGIALDNARDYRGAAEAYERALAIDSKLALAQRHLGEARLALGDRAAARKALEAATALDAGDVQAWIDLALVEVQDGHPDVGARRLEKAAQRNDAISIWYHLGVARELANDTRGAREAYEHVLKADPNHARALDNLALLRLAARETDEGIALLERAVAADPRCVEARKNLGVALYTVKGQGYLALPHLKAYVELGGKDERVAGWIAEIRDASRTYRTDDRAFAVFDRFETGRLVTADQSFRVRDPRLVATLSATLRRGDRVRLVFESATSPNVVEVGLAK